MIYFFHHYELPVIIQQAQVQQILRLRTRQRHQQQNGNGAHGAANNASNIRNGANAANQANNDAMGNNQMNNNGNNPNNNNHRNGNVFTNISFILNFQMATVLFNHALSAIGALQGRLTNDVFGTATFFNNNNDNSLNNNNNNPTANITRLHINLGRLRRINLAGIQINPIQINPAEGTENSRYDLNEMVNGNSNGDGGSDGNGGGDTNGSSNNSGGGEPPNENSSTETSTSHSNQNSCTETENGHDAANETDFTIQREFEGSMKTNASAATPSFELAAADDFDIIDANDEIDLIPNDRAAIGFDKAHIVSHAAKKPFEMTNDMPFYSSDTQNKEDTSLGYDMQMMNHGSSHTKIDACNTPLSNLKNQLSNNDAPHIANDVLNIASNELQLQSQLQQQSNTNVAHQPEISSQKSNFLVGFSNESHSSIQGDNGDISLMNTNFGICTESGGSNTMASSTLASHDEPSASMSSENC